MRRTLLIVLLCLGTLGGFAAGCHSLARHRAAWCAGPGSGRGGWSPRASFEDEVADVCLRAAQRATPGAATTTGRSGQADGAPMALAAGPAGAGITPERAAAAVDRAVAAAERAAAAAERAAASVERATLGGAGRGATATAASPTVPVAKAP